QAKSLADCLCARRAGSGNHPSWSGKPRRKIREAASGGAMNKAAWSQLKSIETSGPDETAFGCIALRFSQCIFNGAVSDLVIAIDVVWRNGFNFPTCRDCDS